MPLTCSISRPRRSHRELRTWEHFFELKFLGAVEDWQAVFTGCLHGCYYLVVVVVVAANFCWHMSCREDSEWLLDNFGERTMGSLAQLCREIFGKFLFHKFVAGMRFACIFIIKIASAGALCRGLGTESWYDRPRYAKSKKSRCFFWEFHQKVWNHRIGSRKTKYGLN